MNTTNFPQDPTAFWRAYERATRQCDKAWEIWSYLSDHDGSDRDIAKAGKRVSRAQSQLTEFELECDARLDQAKHSGADALRRFVGPRWYTLAKRRFRPITDDYIETGRKKNGLRVVESAS